jgi:hypothetical protein
MPLKPFAKGHDPVALAAALAITDRVARQAAMDALPRPGARKLIDPQAGIGAFPAPRLRIAVPEDESAETAAELLEVAGAALLRDVPLEAINIHPLANRLAQILAEFAVEGTFSTSANLTAQLCRQHGADGLFRIHAGRRGPRLGALLAANVPSGWGAPLSFASRRRLGSYGATADEWAALQRGNVPRPQSLSPHPEPIATGRDIASLADQDPPIEIPDLIARLLLAAGASYSSRFATRPNEVPFVRNGGAVDLQCSIAEAAAPAMRCAWKLKFFGARRQRPEELWPRAIAGELHPSFRERGQWIIDQIGDFLPMAYAPGSPLHSDDPSGHAVLAGVGFTLLKAWFADGPVPSLGLVRLHEELDLMASHMSWGRIWAGIHSPSSVRRGLELGQHFAIQLLNRQKAESPTVLGNTSFLSYSGQMLTV